MPGRVDDLAFASAEETAALVRTGALSARNLPGVHIISPDQLNTYDVLKADDVVFSVEALNAYISAAIPSAGNNTVEVSA